MRAKFIAWSTRLVSILIVLLFTSITYAAEPTPANDGAMTNDEAMEYFKERGATFVDTKAEPSGGGQVDYLREYCPGYVMLIKPGCDVQDDDLAEMKYLTTTHGIQIGGGGPRDAKFRVTPSGLKNLADAKNIRALSITDGSQYRFYPDLSGLLHLEYLMFSCPKDPEVRSHTAKQLARMTKLKYLVVHTASEPLFAEMPDSSSIETLVVSLREFDYLDGDFLPRLKRLRELEVFLDDYPNRRLMNNLKKLENLKELKVSMELLMLGVRVSEARSELSIALPNTKIMVGAPLP